LAYSDRGDCHLRRKRQVSDFDIAKLHKLGDVLCCINALALECVARIYKHDNFVIGDVIIKQSITLAAIQRIVLH